MAPKVEIPAYPACTEAYDLAQSNLPIAIFNHSLRVYLHAKEIAKCYHLEEKKLPLLFIACILHDIGCAEQFNGPVRFEVEGADAATNVMKKYDYNEAEIHSVWIAIACHTSPQIAERIGELSRIVREAVIVDFGASHSQLDAIQLRQIMEERFPRLDIEKVLGDTVVGQAMEQPIKAPPHSWPGDLLRTKRAEPDWDGINKEF